MKQIFNKTITFIIKINYFYYKILCIICQIAILTSYFIVKKINKKS